MAYEQLKLENQICFPLYASSRLVTRAYQPHLEALDLTYPQYLVLMVLWEHDDLTVNQIAERLILNTNTLTPLLKRMEQGGLVERTRSREDERKVTVRLTPGGRELEARAARIPQALAESLERQALSRQELVLLKSLLDRLVTSLA